jgi:tetratricopeptide (TPR) repeat protein
VSDRADREFDIILCYERSEAEAVQALAGALSEGGIRVWLDIWDLIPGQRWDDALERALAVAPAVGACIGSEGIGPLLKAELSHVLGRQLDAAGPQLIPIVLPGGDREALPPPLSSLSAVDFSDGFDSTQLARLAAAVLSERHGGSATEDEAGDLLRESGDEAGAEQQYRSALAAAEARYGPDHPAVAEILTKRGLLATARDDLAGAIAFLGRAYGIFAGSGNEEAPEALACLEAYGEVLYLIADYEAAERIYMELVVARRRQLGEADPMTLVALSNLAAVYWRLGRLDEAIGLQVGALDGWSRAGGVEEHAAVAAMANLAGMLYEQGQVEVATGLAERVLEVRHQQLGASHLETVTAMNNLGRMLYERGDLEKAEQLQRETLGRLQMRLGETHPTTLHAMSNLALTSRALGDSPLADRLEAEVADRDSRWDVPPSLEGPRRPEPTGGEGAKTRYRTY